MPAESRRSRRLLLVAGLSCAFAVTAPDSSGQEAGAAARGTTLVANPGPRGGEWKRAFNPFRDDTDTRWPATAGVYEPLLVYSRATRSYLPWLATGYQWGASNLTLRFAIRPGVVWSDGQPFSGRRRGLHLRPDAALLRPRPRGGVGIPRRRQERRRVERRVHLQARLHARASRHRHPAHRRRAQVEGRGPARGLRRPEPGGHRALHGGASLRAHRLRAGPESEVLAEGQARRYRPCGCRSITRNEEILRALEAGELDWASLFVDDIEKRWVAKDPARHLYWYPDFGQTVLLELNTRRTPFDDASVRKAMSMALDRPRIMREALERLRASCRRHRPRRVAEPVEGPRDHQGRRLDAPGRGPGQRAPRHGRARPR